MHRGTWIVSGLTVAVLLSVALYVTAAPRGIAQPARIAVVDFDRLLKECDRVRAADKDFQTLQDKLAKEAEQRIEEVKALRKKLSMHVAGSPAHKKTVEEIEKKGIDNNVWYETKMRGLADRQKDILQAFCREVETVTADYAKAHALSLVLKVDRFAPANAPMQNYREQMMLKKVLYSANDVDITNDVLALLNARYRRGGVRK